MFKRVEKRRKKKEVEEELGLDEDMKDVLGMHDTDSEESDSDSDESSVGDVEDNEKEGELSDIGDLGEEIDSEGEHSHNSSDEDEQPAITVQEALRDPIYLISLHPDVKACIACPGKFLKGGKMVELHRNSKAHERRVKQLTKTITGASPTENAWDILSRSEKPRPSLTPVESSKRAEKRKAKSLARKAKREKQKAKIKAKKAEMTPPDDAIQEKPPKKKRRVDTSPSSVPKIAPTPAPAQEAATPSPIDEPEVTQTAIKNIVRSTSERAKQARARAISKGSIKPRRSKAQRKEGGTRMLKPTDVE